MVSDGSPGAAAWPTSVEAVSDLHLDSLNPRLTGEVAGFNQHELVRHMFEHYKAASVAESIARHGYLPTEPMVAVKEEDDLVVVEGNRRLAALKALFAPTILDGTDERKIERLGEAIDIPSEVPVVTAPSREAADRLLAARHIGTPVLAWGPEKRARFILAKVKEGYDDDRLRDELGLTPGMVGDARLVNAVTAMAQSLDLKDDFKRRIAAPDGEVLTTLRRVVVSTAGRAALNIERDPAHGIRGYTTGTQFKKGFQRLVEDLVSGREDSRTLNKNEDIESYFKERVPRKYRVEQKRGSFVPADITRESSAASQARLGERLAATRRSPSKHPVLPADLRASYAESTRVRDLLGELQVIKAENFPNAGAVALRVFIELAAFDYLRRTGRLPEIVKKIESKTQGRLPYGTPRMRDVVPDLVSIAKSRLDRPQASEVEKALRPNAAAPFTLSDLNSFVHNDASLPTARDTQQFWLRIEPLVRLMLEEPPAPSQ